MFGFNLDELLCVKPYGFGCHDVDKILDCGITRAGSIEIFLDAGAYLMAEVYAAFACKEAPVLGLREHDEASREPRPRTTPIISSPR